MSICYHQSHGRFHGFGLRRTSVRKEFIIVEWFMTAMVFNDGMAGVVGVVIAATLVLVLLLLDRGDDAEARRWFLMLSIATIGVGRA
jgi:hypothetical protein